MELSEEMQEVLRILREDHTVKAFKEMTSGQQALVKRMDEWETRESEREAKRLEREAQAQAQTQTPAAPGNPPSLPEPGQNPAPVVPPNTPTPPPTVNPQGGGEPTGGGDGGKKKRTPWYERDIYRKD